MSAFDLISFFSYLIAALICTAFFVWYIKVEITKRCRNRVDVPSLFFCLFCCVWFYLLFSLRVRGAFPNWGAGRGFSVIKLMLHLCNAFWPAIVYHIFWREQSKALALRPFGRRMIVYFYLVGVTLAGVFLYAFAALQAHRITLGQWLIGWGSYGFLAHFILCGILIFIGKMREHRVMAATPEEPEAKSSRRWDIFIWAAWLFVIWPVVIAGIFGTVSIREYAKYFELLATLMPLPFIIVGWYYEARYAFVDVFIKRSGVIALAALVTAVYYVYVVEKFAGGPAWRNVKYPALLLLLPMVSVIPFLARAVEKTIDRYVLKRQSTPADALSTFSRAIRAGSDETQLRRITKACLNDIFSTRNVMVAFAEDRPETGCPIPELKAVLDDAKGPVSFNEIQSTEAAEFCRQNAIEVVVPLTAHGVIMGGMTLGKRYYKEPYLSEDLKLLSSLADHVMGALENIRLERRRREQELKGQELKILAGKAELRALRAQINPHFLFNALNTIAALIRKSPHKAEETVEMLADVFRYTLARSGTDFIPLAEEVNFINAYLEIEQARFGNKLQVEMNIDPQTEAVKIPAMLLQPLVENGIKHGLSKKLGGGKITVSAHRENGFVKIEVSDNGVGFDVSKATRLYKEGIGLKNVRDRLMALYGHDDYLQIHSLVDQGATISLQIPLGVLEP